MQSKNVQLAALKRRLKKLEATLDEIQKRDSPKHLASPVGERMVKELTADRVDLLVQIKKLEQDRR